jgi:CBS domain-containing protein
MSDLWWLFSRQTVSVTKNESVLRAALLMQRRNFRHLPVIDEQGKIIGMVSAQDVIDSVYLATRSSSSTRELKESLEIPLERIMAYPTLVVEPGDGLLDVVKKFSYHNLGALAVVNEHGLLQGIVTLRDLIGLMGMSSNQLGVRVSEIMNKRMITIESNSPVSLAVQLMSEGRVRRLPVVSEGGELLGVVTNKDILRMLAKLTGNGSSTPLFEKPISQVMTSEVITIGHDDDIRVAASRMMIFGVGGLLIRDLPSNELALITERDLIRNVASKRSVEFLVSAMQYELEASDNTARSRSTSPSLSL